MSKYIYLVFTDTGTYFTRFIKRFTKNPFNHASISMDAELHYIVSFGRKNIHNPFIGGFVRENMENELFSLAKARIYRCKVTNEKYQKAMELLSYFEEQQQRYRYNLLGLIAVLMKKEWNRKNVYFCSQFVATVLQKAAIVNFHKAASLVTPQDLAELSNIELVFEGEIQLYLAQDMQYKAYHA